MPATEQTWRNQNLLNLVFAVSGVVLLIATIIMFYRDHERPWKQIQPVAVNLENKMTKWREEQYLTHDALQAHSEFSAKLLAAQATPVPESLMDKFVQAAGSLSSTLVAQDPVDLGKPIPEVAKEDSEKYQKRAEAIRSGSYKNFNDLADKAQEAMKVATSESADEAAQKESVRAQKDALAARQRFMSDLQKLVIQAKIVEDQKLSDRKFASANWDKAKADYDLGIRDNAPNLPKREADVVRTKGIVDKLTEQYQALATLRKNMEEVVKEISAPVDAAQKEVSDNRAALDLLEKSIEEKRETYFVSFYGIPLPGKQLLNFPIIDAFGTRRRIDNLWADGLEQDYNFRKVRRFDRCTTCHQLMQKSLPGQPTDPAYPEQTEFDLVISLPEDSEYWTAPADLPAGQQLYQNLLNNLGIMLASEGLIDTDDVTIKYVRPESPAAKASVVGASADLRSGAEWLQIANRVETPSSDTPEVMPGLMLGDVITAVNGDEIFGASRTGQMMLDLIREKKTLDITIRRGMPNPYATHTRLDLFVGDSSPHPVGKFACTICHDGQGSATEFKWASHTPDTPAEAEIWGKEYGWFDNHHWIYPMYPKRFAESGCLKCHHNVVELEPSERFPEAPAPKLVHGYHLISKYGCFGCHEINGFDGPHRRVGPDMRLEPNYFAVAQQLNFDLKGKESDGGGVIDQARSLADELTMHPEVNATRHALKQLLDEQAALGPDAETQPVLPADAIALRDMLKDIEVPGTLRKVGPSLRFAAQKLDSKFLYDWLQRPKDFRPTTRMPQFFGLWGHLKDEHGNLPEGEVVSKYEPIEIRGIMAYLLNESQDFEPVMPPEGIDAGSAEDQIARGKVAFETRGCLACHNHKEFPEIEQFRQPDEIVQGPDLSEIAAKFEASRNPEGPKWLYSWIREPTRYHARTVMPNLFLGPEEIPDPNAQPDENNKRPVIKVDAAADIAAYLLSVPATWEPDPAASEPVNSEVLSQMTQENLEGAVFEKAAARYAAHGIPADMAGEFKGAELELLVPREAYDAAEPLSDEAKLRYIGKKTIAKYGCYACHDIPGFEDAKPIGTALADWGRKDPAKLAFEHITHYIEHGHGVAHHDAGGHDADEHSPAVAEGTAAAEHSEDDGAEPTDTSVVQAKAPSVPEEEFSTEFYNEAVMHGNRVGFIYQKLKEPRSYDYKKTENKKYGERLRMPQFPFTAEEREAVITFVIGLVADPPQDKYVYQPNPRNKAIQQGRVVLEKYNCGGCHVLEAEKWWLTFAEGQIREQDPDPQYPFLVPNPSTSDLLASATKDRRGQFHGEVNVLPRLGEKSALPVVMDSEGDPVDEEESYGPGEVIFQRDLYKPALLGGQAYSVGIKELALAPELVDRQSPARGGTLTRYLQPRVFEIEQQANPNAIGTQSWGWLPPPLMGEGEKVQSAWLHDFLLNPYPIRPAVFMRMPKFNMSSAESETLVAYFAALDNAAYPYSYASRREAETLRAKELAYRKETGVEVPPGDERMVRFDDAMKIVVDKTYCVTCHVIDDFRPGGSMRAMGPNLADVYRRMRPEYVRNWIARPTYYLPYTPMPINVPYKPDEPHLGGVRQDLYHGTSIEQVDALVDLLMNFDVYAQQKVSISALAPKQEEKPSEPAAEAAPETSDSPAPAEPAPADAAADSPAEEKPKTGE